MKKIALIGLTASILVAVTFSGVNALQVEYNVMPHRGTPDQEILITIRVDPIISAERIKAYFFWDNELLFDPVLDIVVKGVGFKHSWDIKFTPPVDRVETGSHRIEIWLEEPDGKIKTLYYSYTIEDGLISLSSWDKFKEANPQIMDDMKGDPGEQGIEGEQGIGLRGATGSQGIQGIPGEGIQGIQGIQGVPGRVGWVYLLVLVLVNAGISFFVTKVTLGSKAQ